jgi:hypothetical protein
MQSTNRSQGDHRANSSPEWRYEPKDENCVPSPEAALALPHTVTVTPPSLGFVYDVRYDP